MSREHCRSERRCLCSINEPKSAVTLPNLGSRSSIGSSENFVGFAERADIVVGEKLDKMNAR